MGSSLYDDARTFRGGARRRCLAAGGPGAAAGDALARRRALGADDGLMCGICGIAGTSGQTVQEGVLRSMAGDDGASRPRRRRLLCRRPRRAGPSPSLAHRPRERQPADLQRRPVGGRGLQRRDLQLPRIDRRARRPRPRLPDPLRHRDAGAPLRRARHGRCSTSCGACSRSRSSIGGPVRSTSCAIGSASSRSTTTSGSGRLWFASEVKPIIDAGYPVEVNAAGVHAFMKTRFAHGDETIFKGVFRLPEGCVPRMARRRGAAACLLSQSAAPVPADGSAARPTSGSRRRSATRCAPGWWPTCPWAPTSAAASTRR